ncbi:MAG: glycosyltransferase family 4 protein [Treponema sp.]|nr:glycosyltransferase family 4 protein [Treponema sp.]
MKRTSPGRIRIVQILESLKYGDGIGNDCLAIHRTLLDAGYNAAIFAANIDNRVYELGIPKVDCLDNYADNADIILCHIAYKWDYLLKLNKLNGKKIFVWHNITPPQMLEEYGEFESAAGCKKGLEQVRQIHSIPSLCLTASNYNKGDLEKLGYSCPIHIFPHLAEFADTGDEDYDQELLSRYNDDGFTNILFVGRISPNKRQQDIISSFSYYHRHINPKSRLFIVGGGMEDSAYGIAIREYPAAIGLDNVIFTGHVSDRQKASYYRLADVFLCMSEHEGFCVPLLEAMHYRLPIIAYKSSAVTETLGKAGLLLKNKEPGIVAEAIDRLMTDTKLRDTLIDNGTERLADFSEEKVKAALLKEIGDFIESNL